MNIITNAGILVARRIDVLTSVAPLLKYTVSELGDRQTGPGRAPFAGRPQGSHRSDLALMHPVEIIAEVDFVEQEH